MAKKDQVLGQDSVEYGVFDPDAYQTVAEKLAFEGSFIGQDPHLLTQPSDLTTDEFEEFNKYAPGLTYEEAKYSGGLEEARAQQQTRGEQWVRGVPKFLGKTTTAALGGTVGALWGVGSIIANKDFNAIYDNDFQQAMDNAGEWLDENLAVYATKKERDENFLKSLNNSTFWANDVLGGLSFTAGAIASELVWSAATAATAGALAPMQAAVTARLLGSAGRQLKNISKAQKVISGLTKAGNLQKANDASRVVRQLYTGAGYEAGVEARHHKKELLDKLEEQYFKDNPDATEIPEKELANMDDIANRSSNGVFAANMGVVGLSNMIALPRIFGPGINSQAKRFSDVVRHIEDVGDAWKVAFKPAYSTASKAERLGKLAYVTTKNPFVEGIWEEGMQGVANNTALDYTTKKYNEDGTGRAANLIESFGHGLQETYGGKDGWKEIGIGMIIGGIGSPNFRAFKRDSETGRLTRTPGQPGWTGGVIGEVQELKLRNQEADARATAANNATKDILFKYSEEYAAQNPQAVTASKRGVENLIRQAYFNEEMDKAIAEGSLFDAKNVESDMIHSFIMSRIDAGYDYGLSDEFLAMVSDMSNEEFAKTLGYDDMSEKEIMDRKNETIEKFNKRLDDTRKVVKLVDNAYRANLDIPANRDIRESLIYAGSTINDVEAREKYITDQISEESGIPYEIGERGEDYKKTYRDEVRKSMSTRPTIEKDAVEKQLDDLDKIQRRRENFIKQYNSLFTTEGQKAYAEFLKGTQEEQKKEFYRNVGKHYEGTVTIIDRATEKQYKKWDKSDGTSIIEEIDPNDPNKTIPETQEVVDIYSEGFAERFGLVEPAKPGERTLNEDEAKRLVKKLHEFKDPDELADFINNEIKSLNLANLDLVKREAGKAWKKLTDKKMDTDDAIPVRYVDKKYIHKESKKTVIVTKDNEKEDTYYIHDVVNGKKDKSRQITTTKAALDESYIFKGAWSEHTARLDRIENLENIIESKQALLDNERKEGKSYRKRLKDLKTQYDQFLAELLKKDGRATAKTIAQAEALVDQTMEMINEVQDKIDSSVQAQIKIKQDQNFYIQRLAEEDANTESLNQAIGILQDEINENEDIIGSWQNVVNGLKKMMNDLLRMFNVSKMWTPDAISKKLTEYRQAVEAEIQNSLKPPGEKVQLGAIIKALRDNADLIKRRVSAKKGAIQREINRGVEAEGEYWVARGKMESAENQVALFEKANDQLWEKLGLLRQEQYALDALYQRRKRNVEGVINHAQVTEEVRTQDEIEGVHQKNNEPPSISTQTEEESETLWDTAKRKLEHVFSGLAGKHTEGKDLTSDVNQRRYYRWTSKTDIKGGDYRVKIMRAFDEDKDKIEASGRYKFEETLNAVVVDKDGNYITEEGVINKDEATASSIRNLGIWTSFPLPTYSTAEFEKTFVPEHKSKEEEAAYERRKENLLRSHQAVREKIVDHIENGREVVFQLVDKAAGIPNESLPTEQGHDPDHILIKDSFGHDNVTIQVQTLPSMTIGGDVITTSKLGHTFVKDNETGNTFEARSRRMTPEEINTVVGLFRILAKNSTIDEKGMIHSNNASILKTSNGTVIYNHMFEYLSPYLYWTGDNLTKDTNDNIVDVNTDKNTLFHFAKKREGVGVAGGYLQLGRKKHQLFITEGDQVILNEGLVNEQGEGALVDFLRSKYININSPLLIANEAYNQITGVNEDGTVTIEPYDSYQDYLLDAGVLGVSVPPVTVDPFRDEDGNEVEEEVPQMLNQYAIYKVSDDFVVEEVTTPRRETPSPNYNNWKNLKTGDRIIVQVKEGEKIAADATLELQDDTSFVLVEGQIHEDSINRMASIVNDPKPNEAFEGLKRAMGRQGVTVGIADVTAPAEVTPEVKAQTEEEAPRKGRKPRRISDESGSTRKLYRTPTNDERGVEQLDKAEKWFKERFPNIDFKTVDHLIDGKSHGQLLDAAVEIFEGAEVGTTYHEAFHVVTQIFLNRVERRALYREWRRRNPDKSKYTDRQVEEQLAEDFRDYILFRQETSDVTQSGVQKTQEEIDRENDEFRKNLAEYARTDISEERKAELDEKLAQAYYAEGEMISRSAKKAKKAAKKYDDPVQRSFFQRLYDWIVNMVYGQPQSVKEIFENIENNKYRNETPKIRRKGIKFNRTYEGTTESFGKMAMEGVNYFFFQKLFADKESVGTLFTKANNSEFVNRTYDEVRLQIKKTIGDLQKVQDDPETSDQEYDRLDNVVEQLWFIYDNWAETRRLHENFLTQYRLEFVTIGDVVTETDNIPDNDNQWANQSIKISSKINASRNIKLLVGTLVDVYNNFEEKTNDLELVQNADFGKTFNILVNRLATLRTDSQMVNAINNVAGKYPQVYALIDRLGLNDEGEHLSENQMLEQVQFVQTFAKTRHLYMFDIAGENGKFKVVNSNRTSINEKIKTIWKGEAANKSIYEEKDGVQYYKPSVFEKLGPINTPQKALKMLETMGITYSFPEEVAAQNELIRKANGIYSQIMSKNGQPYIFDNEINVNVKEDLDTLIGFEVDTTVDYIENSHLNIENNLVYDVVLNSYLSLTIDDIQNYPTLKELFEENPHLDPTQNIYTQNSYLLQPGGPLYDKNGKLKKDALVLEIHEGSKEENSDIPAEFEDLGEPDQLRVHINRGLQGSYPLLRPADNSIERYMNFGKTLFTVGQISKNVHVHQMLNYLRDELNRGAKILGDIAKGENQWNYHIDNANQGIVIDIVSQNPIIKEAIDQFFKDSEATVEGFFSDDILVEAIKTQINTYFTDRTGSSEEGFINLLLEHGIIELLPDGNYYNNGLNLKGNPQKISNDVLVSEMKNYLINDTISNIEQTKVIFGDPISYKSVSDQFKRHSGVVGTKKISAVYDQLNRWIDEKLKRTDREGGLYRNGKPIVRTAVFADVLVRAKHFEEYVKILGADKAAPYGAFTKKNRKGIEEGDGQGYISIDEWREMLMRAGEWGFGEGSLEDLYQYEIQKEADPDSTPIYKGRIIDPAKLPVANPLKPQYMGPLAEQGFQMGMYKLSLFPLLPSVTKQFGQLEALRIRMKGKKGENDGIGIAVFQTANKVGTKLNADGVVQPFYDPETGEFAYPDYAPMVTQDTYYKYWGIQQEKGSKSKKKVVFGTQMAKQILNGLYENGRLKEGLDPILAEHVEEYIKLNGERIEIGLTQLVDSLGLVEKDGKYHVKTMKSLIEKLRKEAVEREMPDNIVNAIDNLQIGSGLDTLINREKVENILFSIADAMSTSQKRSGSPKTQVSNAIGKIAKTAVDTETGKVWDSSDLAFYTNKDGKITQMEVYLPSFLKGKITDSMLYNLIGFRIPTQGLNSIDAIKVKGFLPATAGDSVIVPSEVVAKTGSDFDDDKLNIYYPNVYYNKEGNPVYIKLGDDTEVEEAYNEYSEAYQAKFIKGVVGDIVMDSLPVNLSKFIRNEISDILSSENVGIKDVIEAINIKLVGAEVALAEVDSPLIETYKKLRSNLISLAAEIESGTSSEYDPMTRGEFRKRAIENRISEVQKDIVLHPDNFKQLINPISATDLENEADKILVLKGEAKVVDGVVVKKKPTMNNIVEREYLMDVARRFIGGKQAIGITAIHSTFDILSKMSNVSIVPTITVFRNKKAVKISTNINLPHNTNEEGNVTLSKIDDANNEGNIPERLSQWINASVDAATNPFMFDLNSGPNTLNTVLYLTMAGVPLDYLTRFMTQPIIIDYVKNRQKWESQMMEGNIDSEGKAKKKFRDWIVAETKAKYAEKAGAFAVAEKDLTLLDLENGIKAGAVGSFSKGNAVNQIQILDDFLRYMDTARKLGDAIGSVNYDTRAAGKNTSELLYRTKNTEQVEAEGNVNNLSSVLNDGFITPYYKAVKDLKDIFNPLFVTLNDESVVRQFDKLFKILFDPRNTIALDKKLRVVDKFKQSFITYLLISRPYSVHDKLTKKDGMKVSMDTRVSSLFKGPNSVANQLKDKKNDPNYANMSLLTYLEPIFDNSSKKDATDHVTSVSKKLDTIDSNRLTSEWRELIEADKPFAYDLILATALQYGTLNSPFTFTTLIPFEIYGEVMNSILAEERTKPVGEKNNLYDDFYNRFFLNNHDDNAIVPTRKKGSNLHLAFPYFKIADRKKQYRETSFSELSKLREKGVNVYEEKPKVIRNEDKKRMNLTGIRRDYRNGRLLLNYNINTPVVATVNKTDPEANLKQDKFTWARTSPQGYEVSSKGDKRFSAFHAKLNTGETVEQAYQKAKGTSKGKPAADPNFDYWGTYLGLWREWAKSNAPLMSELWDKAKGKILTDQFANTENNQARALSTLLNEGFGSFQLTNATKESPNEVINEKIKGWLDKMGIKYENVAEITDREGNPISAVAKADMLHATIQVVEGKADITTLSEEAAHFLVELLGDDNPILKGMMNAIEGTSTYDEVVAEYGDLYNHDENKLKKEAVGKMIAKAIIRKEKVAGMNRFQRWWDSAWRWIKKHLLRVNSTDIEKELSPYTGAADIILGNVTEGLSPVESLKPDIFYQVTEDEKATAAAIEKSLTSARVFKDLKAGGYKTPEGKTVKNRVSDFTKKFYNEIFRGRSAEEEAKPYNILLRQKGTIIHKYLEILGESIFAGKTPTKAEVQKRVIEDLKDKDDIANEEFFDKETSFFALTGNQFGELRDGMIKLTAGIKAKQKAIDPKGEVKFFPELLIYDKYGDIGGTIDLAVMYSNGSVGIYDYKSINFDETKTLAGFKEDAYNIQISEYKRILKDRYGVKNFGETRVIPIDVQMTKSGAGFSNVVMGAVGLKGKERPYLEQIPVARELTDDKELNLTLKRMFVLYDKLRKKLAGDYYNDKLALRVDRLREAIIGLQLRGDVSFIFGEIRSIYKDFQDRENIPADHEFGLNDDFLRELAEYVNAYKHFGINAMATAKKIGDKKTIHNLQLVADTLDKMERRIGHKYIENANRYSEYDVAGSAPATGFMGRMFNQLSQFKRPTFKKLSEMVHQVGHDIRRDINATIEDIDKYNEALKVWAKSRGMSLQQAFDQIINPDNGNLISKYKSEHFEEKEKAIADKNEEWFLENTQVEKKDGKLYYTGERLESYEKRRKTYFDYLDRTLAGEENAKARDEQKSKWNRKYNITAYPNALFYKHNPYIRPQEKASNYSEKYNYMLQPENKAMLDYYNMYVDYNDKFSELTGKHINYNFVAEIHQDFIEKISDVGSIGVRGLWDSVVRSVELREFDLARGSMDLSTGKPVPEIPLFYSTKLSGNVTPSKRKQIESQVAEEYTKGSAAYQNEVERQVKKAEYESGTKSKSRDLTRSLILFAEASYSHHHLSTTESSALALMEIMKSQGQETELVDAGGKAVMNKYTRGAAVMLGVPLSEIDALEKFINMYWYGQRTQGGDIKFNVGGKEISGTKMYQSILRFTSAGALGMKPILAFGNLIGIKSNSYMTGREGRQYKTEDIHKAHRMLINRDPLFAGAVNYFEPYTHDLTFRKANDRSVSKAVKLFTFENLFVLHRIGDEHIDKNITLALMHRWGINKDGKLTRIDKLTEEDTDKRSLIERSSIKDDKFDVEGLNEQQFIRFRRMIQAAATGIKGNMSQEDLNLIRTTLMGQAFMQFRNWMPGLITKRLKNLQYDDLWDDYDVGRFRVMFGELTAKGIKPKLGAFIRLLGEVTSIYGYDKSGINEEFTQRVYDKFKEANPTTTLTMEEFAQLRLDKLKGMARELQIYLAMMLMVAGGKAFIPEKDEEKLTKAMRLLAQNSYRVTQRGYLELSFFFDPNSITTILKSPLPSLRLFTNIYKMIGNTFDESFDVVFGDEVFDRTPRLYYFSKITPIMSSYYDFADVWETYNASRGY